MDCAVGADREDTHWRSISVPCAEQGPRYSRKGYIRYESAGGGNPRHERPVHDVHMKPGRPARLHGGDLLPQRVEIRRQNRRRKLDHRHTYPPSLKRPGLFGPPFPHPAGTPAPPLRSLFRPPGSGAALLPVISCHISGQSRIFYHGILRFTIAQRKRDGLSAASCYMTNFRRTYTRRIELHAAWPRFVTRIRSSSATRSPEKGFSPRMFEARRAEFRRRLRRTVWSRFRASMRGAYERPAACRRSEGWVL